VEVVITKLKQTWMSLDQNLEEGFGYDCQSYYIYHSHINTIYSNM
jgi:hypothetical protein